MMIHLDMCHPGDNGPWGNGKEPKGELIMPENLIKLVQRQAKLESQISKIKAQISEIQRNCKHQLPDGKSALNGWGNCTLCGEDFPDPEEWK